MSALLVVVTNEKGEISGALSAAARIRSLPSALHCGNSCLRARLPSSAGWRTRRKNSREQYPHPILVPN